MKLYTLESLESKMNVIVVIDLAVAGFLVGANVWFFFLQSPLLISIMGREKFVPIQMKLTKLLFKSLTVAAVLLVVLAWFSGGTQTIFGAVFAAASALIAHFVIIPRALKAGGKGRVETIAKGGDHSVAKFASEGSGPSAAFWHRMVVVFVVLILIGALVNISGIAH